MSNQAETHIIDASPTKGLFIYMLTKDIPLIDAIIDLVDNAVDGARRLRSHNDYTGLWVRLELDEDHFRIQDNCGGIPVGLARKYAFRFGRPEDMEFIPHSVGQFGVGMKRAIFKMGRKFRIESYTESSHFVVEEDVEKWKREEAWEFTFAELEEDLDNEPDQQGTLLAVSSLHHGVSESFRSDRFQRRLFEELRTKHSLNIDKGLAVTLNQIPLQVRPFTLLQSDELKPAYIERSIPVGDADREVKVRIYAGIAESKPEDAGWYVFCNGRTILEQDQTLTTGWGEGEQSRIPKYHNQYARFRGYVFLDSDDPGALPWNTTKTGVDADSPVFHAVRLQMINLMRPVIDFLNDLKEDKSVRDDDVQSTQLERSVSNAKAVTLEDSHIDSTERSFSAPRPEPKPEGPAENRILYYKPADEVARAKEVLRASTYKEVGEKTFDYFYQMECED